MPDAIDKEDEDDGGRDEEDLEVLRSSGRDWLRGVEHEGSALAR